MRDPEKPLKIISGIVSAVLIVLTLYFVTWGKPKEAEAVLEYSAPSGFQPSELTDVLRRLSRDQSFLVEVAIRSKFAKTSDPHLAKIAAELGYGLNFEASQREPTVSVSFYHPKTTTAIDVANAAAAVAKDRLELQQQEFAKEIISQEDAVEDLRKLLEIILRPEAPKVVDPNKGGSCGISYGPPALYKADHDRALRKLELLKAKPVISLGAIHPANLTSN